MSSTYTRHGRPPVDRGDNPIVYCLRLYTQFLQGLFNFNEIGCFHWEPDDGVSEILIQSGAPIQPGAVKSRPALTVVEGPYSYQGLGIDNMVALNLVTEKRLKSDLLSGYMVVYCLADTDVTAQHLAHLVTHGTRANQRLLEGRGGFHQICRPAPSVNAPSPPGALVNGDIKAVMVQVNMPFMFTWTWSTTPRSPSKNRSLDMITQEPRATDFPYTTHARMEKVQLAMSTSPVQVRRLGGSSPLLVDVLGGTDKFQTVIIEKSVNELATGED